MDFNIVSWQCILHFTAHFGCFFLQHWLARIHIMTMTLTAAECIRCNIRRLQCFTISVFFKALSTRFKLLWPNGLIVGTDRCNIKHNYLQFNGAWGRFYSRRDYQVQFLQLFFVNVVNVYFFKSYNLLAMMNGTADIHASQNAASAAAEQPVFDQTEVWL